MKILGKSRKIPKVMHIHKKIIFYLIKKRNFETFFCLKMFFLFTKKIKIPEKSEIEY